MGKDSVADSFVVQLGRYVHELREERGMSPDELAILAGVSLDFVNQFETGTLLVSPNVSIIERLALALDMPHQELVHGFREWKQINGC